MRKTNAIRSSNFLACLAAIGVLASTPSRAEESQAELNKKLSNPVADLRSVPLQYNYDKGIGSADGNKTTLNIQPVLPFDLNHDWNIISRTVLPVIEQHNVFGPSGDQSGLGDTVQSLFFSPKAPTSGGMIWGAGPVFLLPTATKDELGSKKWGIGPTAVALVQTGPWTYGALANHIWSVAGDSNRADVNSTFVQPFFAYSTKTYTTFSLQSESTYNWVTRQWSVPINLQVGQLFKIGSQIQQLTLGARYWAQSPVTGPSGWGFRIQYTLLFPK